jgi:hypothetical protein
MTEIKVKYANDTDCMDCSLEDNTGTPIGLGTYTNILVSLVHIDCSDVAEKYAMNALSGYNSTDFHIDSLPGGTFHIDVQNSVIAAMKKGVYKVVFDFWITDAGFLNGYQVETVEEVYLERK